MTIPPLARLLSVCALLHGCTGLLDKGPLGADDGATWAGDPSGGASDEDGDPTTPRPQPTQGATLPCSVESLLGTYCTSCHNGSSANLSPMPLLTRADLLAPAPSDGRFSVAEMSLSRMRSVDRPMPPGGKLPDEILSAFEAWVGDGLPADSCVDEAEPPPLPFEAASVSASTRQVKTLLTGLAPTAEELARVTANPDELATLIDGWMELPQFELKMRRFFATAFQQSELTGEAFTDQLQTRLLGNGALVNRLLDNLEESFARTVFDIVARGQPFTDVISTRTFVMTPAVMSFLAMLDERRVNDAFQVSDPVAFDVVTTGTEIPFAQSIDPTSARFMHFSAIGPIDGCTKTTFAFKRSTDLFGLLMGRLQGGNGCNTNVTPIFTDADFEDFRRVTIKQGALSTHFYELPKLRTATEMTLSTPRLGFFSTPAFFANWASNEDNEMRVTTNQTLIVALGASFDGSDNTVPVTDQGLADEHAGPGSPCYACHKTLDPMRQFFRQSFTYGYGAQRDPTLNGLQGAFLFEGATDQGKGLGVLASGLSSHPRFASAWAQKLCYYATSAPCSADDPELLRVAQRFASQGFDFKTLVRELFSSPLVTVRAATKTFEDRAAVVSIARQGHLCDALSLRLGIQDLCGLSRNASGTQRKAQVVANAIPADGYSRGAEAPVVLSDTTLFFRGATESLCARIALVVVDGGASSPFKTADADKAISDMVHVVMALAPGDPLAAGAREILQAHYDDALGSGAKAVDAMRSTFVLACTSPSTVAIGL